MASSLMKKQISANHVKKVVYSAKEVKIFAHLVKRDTFLMINFLARNAMKDAQSVLGVNFNVQNVKQDSYLMVRFPVLNVMKDALSVLEIRICVLSVKRATTI